MTDASAASSPGQAADWADRTEQQVLDAALRLAPDQGWTWPMVKRAGAACGLSEGETELLAPHGPADIAALLSRRHDGQAMAALAGIDPLTLKIRDRIARALTARLDAALADGMAERRLTGFLASLRARRTASAFWRARFSDGFS